MEPAHLSIKPSNKWLYPFHDGVIYDIYIMLSIVWFTRQKTARTVWRMSRKQPNLTEH